MRKWAYRSVIVWVCNLCGTVRVWSVHLAAVQRAAHRIMMTVAAASVFWGCEKENENPEEREKIEQSEEKWLRWKSTGSGGVWGGFNAE